MYSIIITTSPIPTNPSTLIIDEVINSIPNIHSHPEVFIVCDGVNIKDKLEYKSGNILDDSNYNQYIQNLKIKYPNFNIIKKDKRQGFAKNVHETLLQCSNEFVLIIQHDFKFKKQVDFDYLLNKYFVNSDINYLGFHDPIQYQNKMMIHNKSKDEIIQCNFWYDKNHLGRKSYYLNTIFNNRFCKVKNFIEDSFGNFQRNDIKQNNNFNEYKSYLLNTENVLENLDGRHFK